MISNLIIKVAQLAMKSYHRKLNNPMSSQKKILSHILNVNKNTVYGKANNFDTIKTIQTYQETIPLETYFDKKYYFDLTFKEDNVLLKDPICHWVTTTGTLGTPKILPLNEEGIKRWSTGSSRQFFSFLLDSPGNEKVLDGKILAYAGQSEIDRLRGIPIGYISGITATRVTNPILLKRLIPSLDVLNIEDWKERLWQFMLSAVSNDVTVITGISPVVLGFLRAIQTSLAFQVEKITDLKIQAKVQNAIFADSIDFEMLWPNLRYFASSGVIVEAYRPLIKELLGDLTILEMYAASEGHFAFQMHEDELGMYLNFDQYFFEFLDINSGEVFLLDEVKTNTAYELIVTNCSGLYRYNMMDIVKFISTDPPKIVVQGRSGNILNIASEKVSEDQLALVLSQAMNTINNCPVDYILSGAIALPLRHKILIELTKTPQNSEQSAARLSDIYDELMKKLNTCYHISRGLKALTPPEIHFLKSGAFRIISEKKAENTGQLEHNKILHIIQPENLDKLIDDEMVLFSYVPDKDQEKDNS
ncbi:MAG: GH3 auxin-responsive promoter family protein [Candidatus Heimdallarchaeota archaeon]|nr:GH3 auxin-responsive promoter family protein [Candidatus Heimdallarchaeota archaeon]